MAAAAIAWASASEPAAAPTSPIVAVLSSDTGPYQEALIGLREEIGEPILAVSLMAGERIPHSARVVVAIGSRAALENYSGKAKFIYLMAPGIGSHRAGSAEIRMEPDGRALLVNIRSVQPKLIRLGVLWRSDRLKDYMALLKKEATASAITLEAVHLTDNSDIPDQLRALYGSVDALWLPPDPLLLNSTTLPVLVEFSRANGVPLFVPTAGLVEHGATASFGPSFRELGRLAGAAAKRALTDEPVERNIYAVELECSISKASAERSGIDLSRRTPKAGERLLP